MQTERFDYRYVLREAGGVDACKPDSINATQWASLYADLAAREVADKLNRVPLEKIEAVRAKGTFADELRNQVALEGCLMALPDAI